MRTTVDALSALDQVTDGGRRELRCAELAYEAAQQFPGLLPTRAEIDEERSHLQKDKQGLEIRQGEFFARVLADSTRGHRLIGAMGRPLRQSIDRLQDFQQSGYTDLGTVELERRGRIGWITLKNLSSLNAEDDASTRNLEIAVDLVLLDPEIEAGVLRGAPMTHAKHLGRRIIGERLARQALFMSRVFPADSAEGRLLADHVVDRDEVESTVRRLAEDLTAPGRTSLLANRRVLRIAVEPLDLFRRYMATYAVEQARCLYSPALIDNLERNWGVRDRQSQ